MNKFNMHTMAVAISLAFSAGAMAQTTTKAGVAADYKSAAATCASLTGNAKDICMVEAKGKEKVAMAELEARQSVALAKADAAYALAKEKCDDKSGNDKSTCMKDAKAAHADAKNEATMAMKTAAVSKPAKEMAATPARQTAAAAPAKQTTAMSSDKRESAGDYVDDAVITTKVKAAVLEAPSLKSAEINVETYKGTVQLTGFVKSRADIDQAVKVAKGVKGVKSVKNDMVLKGAQ